MKRVVYILFLLVLIVTPFLYFTFAPFTALANQYIYFSPCDTPIKYKIGSIDSRFNISQSQFLQDIRQAEAIWENINSKNMFEYDIEGELDFNLEYDNRQSLNTQIGQLEGKLDSGRSTLDSNIKEYEALVEQFNQRVKTLNERISYWNSQGGAPPEEYEKLVQEQKDVNAEAQRLNDMARGLNLATRDYNTQVGELNQTINTFRQELSFRPEEGLYDSKEQKITIYITSSQEELIHTLAHEMGHALTIKHVEDEKAIMFPFSSQELSPSIADINALEIACQKQNRYAVFLQNARLFLAEKIKSESLFGKTDFVEKVNPIIETSLNTNVVSVIDGDTIKINLNGKEESVRLIGIDAPETVDPRKSIECFGRQASEKAKEMLTGKTVRLESDPTQGDKDKYGRLLRYIFLDELNFNKFMISEGYAHEYTYQSNPYKYQQEFENAERFARENKKGLWSDMVKCSDE